VGATRWGEQGELGNNRRARSTRPGSSLLVPLVVSGTTEGRSARQHDLAARHRGHPAGPQRPERAIAAARRAFDDGAWSGTAAAARGSLLGVLRGTRELTGQTVDTLASTAGSVVKATAEVGGDVAATAKAAVEGAIEGAKEIGVDAAEAAWAAASGALKAAGDVSAAAVKQVQKAATGVISGVKVVVKAPFSQ